MDEFLLKIRVYVKRMFTPILRITLTPLNYDVSFVCNAFVNRLIQRGGPFLIFTSLGLNNGDPGGSRF